MRCDCLTKVSTQKRGAGARTFLLFFYVFNPRLIGRMMRRIDFGLKTNFLISSAFYQIPLLTLLLYHIRYNIVNYTSYFSNITYFFIVFFLYTTVPIPPAITTARIIHGSIFFVSPVIGGVGVLTVTVCSLSFTSL